MSGPLPSPGPGGTARAGPRDPGPAVRPPAGPAAGAGAARRPGALSGGFAHGPIDAAHVFRAALEAMARPGAIRRAPGARPPAPLSPALGALILVLCDADAPLHLAGAADIAPVREWVVFHTGAPLVARAACAFAAGPWEALLPLGDYASGTPERPHASATLLADLPALEPRGAILAGPGIAARARLSLPEPLIAAREALGAPFPLGLDWVLCAGEAIAALPRTTRIEREIG